MNNEPHDQESANQVGADILGQITSEHTPTKVVEELSDIVPSTEVKNILPSKEVLV